MIDKLVFTLLWAVTLSESVTAQNYFNRVHDIDSLYDSTQDIIEVNGNNYITVIGSTNLVLGYSDAYMYYLNSIGDTLWTHRYNFSPTGGESAVSIINLGNGIYASGGTLQDSVLLRGDYFLFKFDSLGNVLWEKQYGISFNDYCESIELCSDTGFILAGSSYDSLNTVLTANLIRLDSSGNVLWNRHYNGGTNYCEFYDVKQTTDGGFIATGRIDFSFSERSGYIVRTNATGDTLWTRFYNINNNTKDALFGVDFMQNGNIVLCGGMVVNNTVARGYVMMLDSTGNLIWERNFQIGSYNAEFLDLLVDASDNIFCVGMHYDLSLSNPRPSGWMAKIDPLNGDTLWNRIYRYYPLCDHYLYSINKTADNGFVLGGYSITNCSPTKNDIWIVKVDSNGCDTAGCFVVGVNETNYDKTEFTIFPNPSSNTVHVKLNSIYEEGRIMITDQLSRIIYQEWITKEKDEYIFDTSQVSEGLINCMLINQKGNVSSKKIMIAH